MARDADDLAVVSALLQDAVVMLADVSWRPSERRFAFLAQRYRWEDPEARERTRCGVHFDGALSVRVKGAPPPKPSASSDAVLSVLAVSFEPATEPPGGLVRITCAGDAAFEIAVDALDVALSDIGAPRKARMRPRHS